MGKTKRKAHAEHTHRYIKVGGKYASCWKCGDPACTHFVYVTQAYIIEGRYSMCWECGQKFVMDEDAMMEDMPRCFNCRNPELANV